MIVGILLLAPVISEARTLVVSGRLSSEVNLTQQVVFGVDSSLSELVYRFPVPARVQTASVTQRVGALQAKFDPQPESVQDEDDTFGNHFKVVTWRNVGHDCRATIVFNTAIDAVLDPLSSKAPFPLQQVSEEARLYLKPTKLVESGSGEIVSKASRLTEGITTESGAVDSLLNFVANNTRYRPQPKSFDALYALSTGSGNCQNYAHLSCALLRAAGIPSRVVVGYTLKNKWKIPLDGRGSSLVQAMGEGLHSWIEVYYPDLGWLPYDPLQSKLFTSSRHIKYAHGLDASGIGAAWHSSPVLPRYQSAITSKIEKDLVQLSLKGEGTEPRGYLASSEIAGVSDAGGSARTVTAEVRAEAAPEPSTPQPQAGQTVAPQPAAPVPAALEPVSPAPAPAPEKGRSFTATLPPPGKDGVLEFGNIALPQQVGAYVETETGGEAAFSQETAEYVTSSAGVYAQAFKIDRPVKVEKVSLAMKKFGGDGSVYVDILADDQGKPAHSKGVRSKPLFLDKLGKQSGYQWVDFSLPPENEPLKPGKYWIVVRRSGEAVVNWYYSLGKPYGGPDDTRSTAQGWQWEDILTYDFVFKVSAKEVAK
ncbi:transglutaminase-like domain-containing protein [Geomonas sp. Red32]|nr:transglutaminase-like domain-containing protein [Geomonas sp. Red32]MCM0083515.1 transglutaminase-like domain-containing protein [Geomonas sp. Red32]